MANRYKILRIFSEYKSNKPINFKEKSQRETSWTKYMKTIFTTVNLVINLELHWIDLMARFKCFFFNWHDCDTILTTKNYSKQ